MCNSRIRTSLYVTALMFGFATIPFGQTIAQDGSVSMQQASHNQTVPDKATEAWITTKVKSGFGTTESISATYVSASTSDGVATLSGTVASAMEKANAERVAQATKDAMSVDASGLTVGRVEK